jgi:hypothetical protein
VVEVAGALGDLLAVQTLASPAPVVALVPRMGPSWLSWKPAAKMSAAL